VAVALNRSNYEKCINQIYKDLNVVHRQFRVQYQVPLKHQKYHRFAFKRIYFQLHGKCSLLSIRSADAADSSSEGPGRDTYDKPWKQPARGDSKPTQPLAAEEDNVVTTSTNSARNHTPPLLPQSTQGSLVPPRAQSPKEPPIAPAPDAIKRTLRPLLPPNSITQEIPLSAAPILLQLTARVASHLGAIFKRQVSHLVLDFAKNSSDEYVLIEILGFQFSGYGPDVGTSGRVLSLPPELQYKVEHFYRCRLNGMKFRGHHAGRTGVAAATEEGSADDTDSDDESSASSTPQSHATSALDPKKLAEAITPQTLTCRMCTRKMAPGSIRYLLTSVMMHSTIVHLRSRLPLDELPDFCRDRSMTMKSMQRVDDMSSSLCPKKLDAVESDLVTCECCYALYKGESRLMEVEHKMAKFTRTAGTNSMKFDLRGKTSKPLIQPPSAAAVAPVIEMAPAQPVLLKRMSVSGGNIMTRPLSAPPLTSPTQSPAPSRAKITPAFSRTSTLTSVQSDLLSLPGTTTPPVEKVRTQASHLRDTFRAKNSPNRTVSKEFYQTTSPLRRMQSGVENSDKKGGTQRQRRKIGGPRDRDEPPVESYPPISPIPIGRPVTRSDIMSQPLTLGRMMVALHKVTDLPVIFLDAYEDFHVSYVSLGRRREAPCMKNFTFTRNRANRFKNRHLTRTTTNIGRILEGDENSSQTSSSHGTSLCSDPSSGFSEEEDEKEEEEEEEEREDDEEEEEVDPTSAPVTQRGSIREADSRGHEKAADLYPITRRTSQAITKEKVFLRKQNKSSVSAASEGSEDEEEEEEVEEEPEICVGSLDVKYMRMSYFMVPGDATEEDNAHFNHFVSKSGRILVILCAKLKPHALIDERHWVLPDETKTARAKAHKLRNEISAIRRQFQSKVSPNVSESAPLPYDPREDIYKTTDTGDPLPPDAIGYSYISISQFKSNAVKRLDIGAPFTYAIKHLPRERSVPMLRVGSSSCLPLSLSLSPPLCCTDLC
jgi:hypothetical protein